ncbi:MAG TPA: CinA family nicotinamide mononucleotide deamidase-related protein [Lacipirellulaceae bacterium]|jgi:nicotinamide-nucleotide amidase
MRAEIIAIGDELTTGQRLDTNSQWLSERLTELGIEVAFHTTVGDDLDTNVAVFRSAIERADFVVATGGLGPTADDLTREAIAVATGVDLVEDEAALAHIRQLFARRARTMPERNVLQAQFPRGSRPIPNPHGSAPGIQMTIARECCAPCRLFALPGVPAEMFAMWAETVAPAIAATQLTRRITRHRCIKCFGASESHLEAMLPDMIRRGREPRVGITVSDTTITLRITASGSNEAACRAGMEPTVRQIHDSLGVLVFGEEEDELQHAVVRLLDERKQTAAVAEWATDGLVAHWLADAAAGNDCLRGGVVVGSAKMLSPLLGIALPQDADDQKTIAEAMARAIRDRTGADYGLAVAGLPLATVDQLRAGGELAGTLHIALATGENVRVKGYPLSGHPAIVRSRAAKQALNMLRLALLNS